MTHAGGNRSIFTVSRLHGEFTPISLLVRKMSSGWWKPWQRAVRRRLKLVLTTGLRDVIRHGTNF